MQSLLAYYWWTPFAVFSLVGASLLLSYLSTDIICLDNCQEYLIIGSIEFISTSIASLTTLLVLASAPSLKTIPGILT